MTHGTLAAPAAVLFDVCRWHLLFTGRLPRRRVRPPHRELQRLTGAGAAAVIFNPLLTLILNIKLFQLLSGLSP